MAFYMRFFNPVPTMLVIDIVDTKQLPKEFVIVFIECEAVKAALLTALSDSELTKIMVRIMAPMYWAQLTAHGIPNLSTLASKAIRIETLFKDEGSAGNIKKYRPISNIETNEYEYSNMEVDSVIANMKVINCGEVAKQAVTELVKGKPFPCPKLQHNASRRVATNTKKAGVD